MLTWYSQALSLLGIVKVVLLSFCVNLSSYSGLLMGVRSCLWNWFKIFSLPNLFSHMFVLFVFNPKISKTFVILQVKFLIGKIALGFLCESLTVYFCFVNIWSLYFPCYLTVLKTSLLEEIYIGKSD